MSRIEVTTKVCEKIKCDICEQEKSFDQLALKDEDNGQDVCKSCIKLLPSEKLVDEELFRNLIYAIKHEDKEYIKILPNFNNGIFSLWGDTVGNMWHAKHKKISEVLDYYYKHYDYEDPMFLHEVFKDGKALGASLNTNIQKETLIWKQMCF